MTDVERLGTAISLAIFLHFLLLIYRAPEKDIPVTLHLEVVAEDSSLLNPDRPGSGTGLSTASPENNSENELRNKKRQAWLKYLDEVDAAIHARRLASGRPDLIGTTLCAFTILPDGSFANIRIIKSSGNPLLDQDALMAVKAAGGIIKRPEIIGGNKLEVSLWIKYQYGLN